MREQLRDAAGTREIMVGDSLRERYVLLKKLGNGTVFQGGAVFQALDRYRASLPEGQRCIALKILRSGDARADQTSADLRREFQPAQSLSHQNIVNVYELDRDGDIVFFTMELLEGECLSGVIERMRPSGMHTAQAWQFIRQLVAGLQHAHERGIVHGRLCPQNVFITQAGELRILNFGAPARISAAYASCEQLEGRPAEAGDDLYALACIAVELLTGSHPFESRPATLARDFGVRPVRPAGLGNRQWRALLRGLSWHRGGRSMSVGAWLCQLTNEGVRDQELTPLHEVCRAGAARSNIPARSGAAIIAALLITALCVPRLWSSSAQRGTDAAVLPPAREEVKHDSVPAPQVESTAGVTPAAGSGGPVSPTPAKAAEAMTSVRTVPATVSADSTPVRLGDRFVEVRVRRSRLRKNATFTWWTETATAKQGVDFEPQPKAIQTFPAAGLSTRFYVKLLPGSVRSERGFFYVAIAPTGRHESAKVTRLQIWLPRSRDQLQARR